MLQHQSKCGRSERKLFAMRSDFGSSRTTSIRTKWSMQKRQQNFRAAGGRRKKRQQCFASGGLLLGDDGGTDSRYGNEPGEV